MKKYLTTAKIVVVLVACLLPIYFSFFATSSIEDVHSTRVNLNIEIPEFSKQDSRFLFDSIYSKSKRKIDPTLLYVAYLSGYENGFLAIEKPMLELSFLDRNYQLLKRSKSLKGRGSGEVSTPFSLSVLGNRILIPDYSLNKLVLFENYKELTKYSELIEKNASRASFVTDTVAVLNKSTSSTFIFSFVNLNTSQSIDTKQFEVVDNHLTYFSDGVFDSNENYTVFSPYYFPFVFRIDNNSLDITLIPTINSKYRELSLSEFSLNGMEVISVSNDSKLLHYDFSICENRMFVLQNNTDYKFNLLDCYQIDGTFLSSTEIDKKFTHSTKNNIRSFSLFNPDDEEYEVLHFEK